MVSIKDNAAIQTTKCPDAAKYAKLYEEAYIERIKLWEGLNTPSITEEAGTLITQKIAKLAKWAYRKGKRGRALQSSMEWGAKMWTKQELLNGKVPQMHKELYASLLALYDGDTNKIPTTEIIALAGSGYDQSSFMANVTTIAEDAESQSMISPDMGISPMQKWKDGYKSNSPVWDKDAKKLYLKRFIVSEEQILSSKNDEDNRYFIPLPTEIDTIKISEGANKGKEVIGVWVYTTDLFYTGGEVGEIVLKSKTKEEAEVMLSWYCYSIIQRKLTSGDIWAKVNKWLYNVKGDSEKPKLLGTYTYKTDKEAQDKENFLHEHLPVWEHVFITGIRLKKDGTPYKTTRGHRIGMKKDGEIDKEAVKKHDRERKQLQRASKVKVVTK